MCVCIPTLLRARYTAASYRPDQLAWLDMSGAGNHARTRGPVQLRLTSSEVVDLGFKAPFVRGDYTTVVDFPDAVLPANYT